jgi:hypothetical protein
MADNVETAVFEILKKIQGDLAAFRSEMGLFQTKTDQRFQRVEDLIRKQRRDHAAMLIIVRATAGDFDERVSEVEARIAALEAKTS